MHPDLVHAVAVAAISKALEGTKRKKVSPFRRRRHEAEEFMAASVVAALAQRE